MSGTRRKPRPVSPFLLGKGVGGLDYASRLCRDWWGEWDRVRDAERFLRGGEAVVVLDSNGEQLRAVESALKALGPVACLHGDVAVDADLERAAAAADGLGTLGVWVNNAAYNIIGAIHEIDRETYDRGMAVDFGGVFWGTAIAVRRMLESGGGNVINISSVQALVGLRGFRPTRRARGRSSHSPGRSPPSMPRAVSAATRSRRA